MMFECPMCLDNHDVVAMLQFEQDGATHKDFVRVWQVNDESHIVQLFCIKHRILIAPPSWPDYGEM